MIVFLDSSPLATITQPHESDEATAITKWAWRIVRDGGKLIVPAVIHYELRRELLRARKTKGLVRLESFILAVPGRYLPLSDQALRLGAELWAQCRQKGRPTADDCALDVDVPLAAQAMLYSQDTVIATSNAKHLAQFHNSRHWNEID